ncbi:MAG: HEAT repeat domain-containing protein [Leptolyngbya sp. UWPOB_LEPTO1]|uniref:NACHT domain-containing protein n=1 Tax=Leptolyngbya sp. UWPOB_LEPTO1 TaxID=2815653 RepID=UPI001AC9CA4C|nr:HEAT repeat domain-containing protein [Leptolyngbya sp. UWPOB_LEPTO1]MBN8560761.1 HEAT repeat domain-containing protein [Leptolyngbya sp. UWPOB_LEPTO1]
MARPSYGPEAKKRSLHLFTTLLDYANDELDCDEVALDGLRSQIQTHWQTEQRLVVRTKVRFLEALTNLAKSPLNGEQIKEALRRFEDFLEILDDNRPNKGGSEVWHFTLNLWHKRSDRPANLRQFEQEWEKRRPQKSKQVTGEEPIEPEASGADRQDFWWQLCRNSLELQQYERLTINPLTVSDGMTFNLDELYLPLGLIERKQRHRKADRSSVGSPVEDGDEPEDTLSLEEFFDRLRSLEKQRIAIVGEPGAGKTTLLQKIAVWLLEQGVLPIWISLADLQGATLENYLLQDWLKQATGKISVPLELQEAFAQQFEQGRVWLLLDAIDEMAMDATTALSSLARQLRGWIANAHIMLTCRSNVWDSGKNALDGFTVYCNRSFSYRVGTDEDQVGQFIDRWFQDHLELGDRLQQELNNPQRKRVRDAVKNPLRLALLCRSWSLAQGALPQTKSLLYRQFVETLYEWKQDRFPTTIAQRQQLNEALGQVALRALLQRETRFRLSHSFAQIAFAGSLDLMTLALQLGWLNQVGISVTTGEKIYAFYHTTFQEYFAAQAISDWQFFFDPAHDFPVFHASWREVILLWLGRTDIAVAEKEAFITALMNFDDRCGGFYSHRAYCLAAAGLAEFPQSGHASKILAQLLQWRFGVFPASLCEGARIALLRTDRQLATSALEEFVQIAENPFTRWQAAYTLGKTLDPGNSMAIAALRQLIDTLQSEALKLQVIESLGRIEPSHPIVLTALEEILESTQEDNIRRRAAYSLGKINPGHGRAIATLKQIIHSTENATLRLRTAENLIILDPQNTVANAVLQPMRRSEKTSQKHQNKTTNQQDLKHLISTLEQRLLTAKDWANQRRIAYRLATLQPGHPGAIDCLLQILLNEKIPTHHKRVVEDLKEVMLENQLSHVVYQLSLLFTDIDLSIFNQSRVQLHECHKLLSYCAQQMSYAEFSNAWRKGA